MLRIAICDDDENMVQNNTVITEEVLRQCRSAGEISAYTRSSNLLCDIMERHGDCGIDQAVSPGREDYLHYLPY